MSAQLLADELARIIDTHPRTQSANETWMMLRVSTLAEILQALRAQGEPVKYERKFMGFWFACDKSFYERRDDLPGIEFRALGILLAPPNERAK